MPKWLVFSILSVLFWGVWTFVSKLASGAMSPYVNQVLASVGLVPTALMLIASKETRKGEDKLRGAVFGFTTGLLGGLGNIAFYAALADGKASVVGPLTAVYPLVTVVTANMLLREKLNRVQIYGIVLAIIAVLCFAVTGDDGTSSTTTVMSAWLFWSLIALALWGFTGVTQKLSTNYVSAELSYLCFAIAFVPISMIIISTQRLDWGIATKDWIVAILGGVFLGIGTLTSFVAYRAGGSASIVTTLAALYPVVTVIMAVPLLHEKIGVREVAGIVLAIVGGVALAYEEKPKPEVGMVPQEST